jgi:DNA excision repair protein ERCC-8
MCVLVLVCSLLSAGGDGLIGVYDVANSLNARGFTAKPLHSGKLKGRDHGASVSCVQWYPYDTGMFVSGGCEGRVCVWDTNAFSVAHSFPMGGVVHAARMSGVATTHALIAVGSAASPHVRLCDINSGAASHTLLGHSAEVLTVDWCPCNEFMLATGSADKQLRVWDIRRAGAVMSLDQYNQQEPQLNRRYLDVRDQQAKRDVAAHDGAVHHVRWLAGGKQIASAGTDRKLRLWDSSTGRNELVNFEAAQAAGAHRMNRFAASPDGRHLFLPVGLAVHQYAVSSGRLTHKLRGHLERVHCVATNPATHELYSSGADRHILVWAPAEQGKLTEAQAREEAEEAATERQAQREAMDAQDREAQMRLLLLQAQQQQPAVVAVDAHRRHRAAAVLAADQDNWSDED